MKFKSYPFYLLVSAIFLLVISPNLLSGGMFMDGLFYATISRNLSEGAGSFWFPFFTETVYPQFHEHPPLAMGLQSLWFFIFGDYQAIERLYSLFTFVVTGFILVRIWKKTVGNNYVKTAWIPLLFWLIIPVVSWSACNNMLENTMMIFTSLSVLFVLVSRKKHRFIYLLFASFSVFLAFLSKGFVGVFTLSFPFLLFVFDAKKNIVQLIKDYTILISGIVTAFLLIYFFQPKGLDSILLYIDNQVVKSIKEVKTTDYRFWIVVRLLKELIFIAIIIFIIWISTIKNHFSNPHRKWSIIFMLLALSGILPIMVSMKQSGFYMLPALPFISISLALFILPRVEFLLKKINEKSKKHLTFTISSVFIFIAGLFFIFLFKNEYSRDSEQINDVLIISEIVPQNSTIDISPDLNYTWSLHGYFFRYSKISLDNKNIGDHQFLLITKSVDFHFPDYKYEKIPLNLKLYDLYKKK